jgi:hypothetical protein
MLAVGVEPMVLSQQVVQAAAVLDEIQQSR